MTTRWVRTVLHLAVVLGISASLALPASADDSTTAWQVFRSKHPSLLQTIAVRTLSPDRHVVILSEPPPHVSLEALREIVPGMQVMSHPIGYDGFVKDAVGEVRGDAQALLRVVRRLAVLAYGTTYGDRPIDIDRMTSHDNPGAPAEVVLTPDELLGWLSPADGPELGLVPLDGGSPVTLSTVDGPARVMLSDPEGVVALWLPNTTNVAEELVPVRVFAVESDYLLGAAATDRGLLILGRERQLPFDRLPPMRAETVALLAWVTESELAQTINAHPLNCYINDDPVESWQINLLSPSLRDTEYGALLSISDVLLKSWSQNGLNRVRGWHDYPDPARWIYPVPMSEHLGGDSLVFNYNSAAAAAVLASDEGANVLAVARSGVLPISYIPDEGADAAALDVKTAEAEEAAYEWFASQGDRHLMQVVRYAALYQAFRTLAWVEVAQRDRPEFFGSVEKPVLREWLEEINGLGREERQKLAASMAASAHSRVLRANVDSAGPDEFDAETRETLAKLQTPEGMLGLISDIPRDPDELDALAQVLSAGWQHPLGEIMGGALQWAASATGVHDRLGQAAAEHAAGWIHTPVIIVDANGGGMRFAVGGHNLPGRAPRIVADPKAPAGAAPHALGDGLWAVSAKDIRRVRLGRAGVVELETTPRAIRTVQEALGLPGARSPVARGPWDGIRRAAVPRGENGALGRLIDRLVGNKEVVVTKDGEGGFLVIAGRHRFRTPLHEDVIDWLGTFRSRADPELTLVGFGPEDGMAFIQAAHQRRLEISVITRAGDAAEIPFVTNFQERYLTEAADFSWRPPLKGSWAGTCKISGRDGQLPVEFTLTIEAPAADIARLAADADAINKALSGLLREVHGLGEFSRRVGPVLRDAFGVDAGGFQVKTDLQDRASNVLFNGISTNIRFREPPVPSQHAPAPCPLGLAA